MVIEHIILWTAALILVSVISSKLSDKFAIPALLLFLAIGMLAGSEGIGGIHFDNPQTAKSVGIVSLIFIIFSGGLNTSWKEIKPVIGPAVVLSTAGVLLTAVITGCFAVYILKFSWLEGMLLGSIVSSTDAAAVFSILRSKRINLRSPLKPLLEFESGSNDPMAVFLTIGFISVLTVRDMSVAALAPMFLIDMSMGLLVGYLMARFSIYLINVLKLDYEGLYPVIMISLALLTYVTAVFLKGNGILAVYLAGLIIGQADLPYKKMMVKFHDGLAWLMQIAMFITLGLLVFPSHLVPQIGGGLLLTFLLMAVARPVSVLLCLLPFKMNFMKKVLVAWVGLRGSVPIILATFPLLAGVGQADTIFNVVFFVVIASVLIQGTSIPLVSQLLKLDLPMVERKTYPIEFEKTKSFDAELIDMFVPFASEAVGKRVNELGVPEKLLIVLISRGEQYIIPSGSTIVEGGDILLVLANAEDVSAFQKTLFHMNKEKDQR